MRIILIGQAAFAEKTLTRLVDKGEEVVAVFCPPDAAEGRFDPVKQRAVEFGIPIHQHTSMKREQAEVVRKFEELDADLAILAFVTQIVPPAVFNIPKWGSICFHPSLLPRYRGRSALNWALINGETTTGLTLFWVDEGIDTGPVLLQKAVAVGPDDTTGTLYFDKIFALGVDAIVESVDLIKAGNPPRLVQDESQANYDPPCGDEHGQIDWAKPARQIYNQVRGCDPQPGAHTAWRGHMIRLYDCRLQPATRVKGHRDHTLVAGQVIEVGQETVSIAASGGTLVAGKMRAQGRKLAAADVARQSGFGVGDKLG